MCSWIRQDAGKDALIDQRRILTSRGASTMSYGSIDQARWFEAANDVAVSRHAFKRCEQRGLQLKGLDLVMEFGEPVNDGFLMTHCAVRAALQVLRQEGRKKDIQHLSHLHNVAVIEEKGVVLTAFRADKKRIRRLRAGHVQAA
jgi:hypothetical protein